MPSVAPIAALLLSALILTGISPQTNAAGSFSVRHGQHPRLYLNPDRVNRIQADTSVLAAPGFPQVQGGLSFDIYTHGTEVRATKVFDQHDHARNHIFIRYCDEDPYSNANPCIQVALQSRELGGKYAASKKVYLNSGSWNSISVSWNSKTFSGEIRVNEDPPVEMLWSKDEQGDYNDWRPDQQLFIFHNTESVENIRVYSQHTLSEDSLVSGFGTTSDDAFSSVITKAWSDTSSAAESTANDINAGGTSADVHTGHPSEIVDVARFLGLGYIASQDSQYLSAAGKYINQLVGVVPRSTGGEASQAGRIEAMGILYDWFYDQLSSNQKSKIATAIKETIPLLSDYICGGNNSLTTRWSCKVMPPEPPALDGHSYRNNKAITAGVLAIVDEHPQLMPLLDVQHTNFSENYDATRAWVGVDGGHHMGWSYGSTYRSLDSILLWKTATSNSNMLSDWQGKTIDFYIYGLRGDMSFPMRGDAFSVGLDSRNIASFALWASQKFDNRYAQNFYNQWIKPAQGYSRIDELLHWRDNYQELPIEQLELSRHFRNAGTVLTRDSWDYPNATLLEFKSASFWSKNHHHLDQNSISLFYKAPLLIDSGYYDDYDTAHWNNYYTRTIAHNSITVWDPDEVFERSVNYSNACCSNDGGQRFMEKDSPRLQQIMPGGANSLDGIVSHTNSESYSYARGNASRAYSAAKLDQANGFVRDVLYLRDEDYWNKPIIVTFDKVIATKDKADLKKRFLLHTVNEPTGMSGRTDGPGIHDMDDSLIAIRNGDGLLYSQTVLPEDALVTKIGGHNSSRDYRFLVPVADDESNYQLEGDLSGHKFKSRLKNSGVESTDMGSWRIEIMARAPEEKEYFLHVMSVADASNTSGPPVVENLSNAFVAAAQIGGQRLVAFSKAVEPASTLSVSYGGSRPDILLAGLVPNSFYALRKEIAVDGGNPGILVSLDTSGSVKSNDSGLLEIPSSLSIADPESGALPLNTLDNTEYGYRWGNGLEKANVTFWFESIGEDLELSLSAYDIDNAREVSVYINGNLIGYLSKGSSNSLNAGDTFAIPVSEQVIGLNQIEFRQRTPGNIWGVTNVLLAETQPVTLTRGTTNSNEYGYRWGDGLSKAQLAHSFQSTETDLHLSVTGYDIDRNDEITVLLNGEFLGTLSKGPNNGLNAGDRFAIPASKQVAGENLIVFKQLNPGWVWGVTNLLLSE